MQKKGTKERHTKKKGVKERDAKEKKEDKERLPHNHLCRQLRDYEAGMA